MQTTILITGVNGFIGKKLSYHLLEKGYRIIGQSRKKSLGPKEIIPYISDLKDKEEIKLLLQKYQISIIVHLAGASTVASVKDKNCNEIIILTNLLDSIKEIHKKPVLFYASSSKVYSNRIEGYASELDQVNPTTTYGEIKSSCEKICKLYYSFYDVPSVMLRFGNVYGVGDHNTSRIVPKILTSLYNNEMPSIFSDGKDILDYVYVEDVVDCISKLINLLSFNKIKIGYEILNVGSGTGTSTHEVIRIAVELFNNIHNQKMEYSLGDKKSCQQLILSMQKIENLTGWVPKYCIYLGIHKTIKSWL
ncbi:MULTISPECIES: NAD(P)-dependent oxidoreductase [unclassified Planococcus (in: firmicutes)]|uniref:NAD-dependent epimerase/dehydratase family protein n=1 Tax=unclassified Planococcus (in: firmicutes) TaxID=2662419 RepID=UPI000C7A86CF|nr:MULTISPECIES: NAD(P)-dependent oxidoreductase [unclassified Planococcus (in: firmicutes)]PKG48917.1 hypothetical protein CXF66_00055 [Planococcus sp. Urea-trap-24]PKG89692.1 hypothetical protein CXF91_05775 [Planococcus sp. Urea-3u-39]PKH36720.1 hypothetical protein CXF77_14015 [Planococcus sp. MB-3u-09]